MQPSVEEVDSVLTGPGGLFEIETIEIGGRPARMWKDAPRVISDIVEPGCGLDPIRALLVLSNERLPHETHRDRVKRLVGALVKEFGVRKRAREPMDVGDHTLEPGTTVLASSLLIQRDPRAFPRPHDFLP